MMPPRIPVLLALLSAAALVLVTGCAGKAIAPHATAPPPSNETQRLGVVVLEDGIVLSGRLFGPANDPVVILAHMRPNDQTAWFSFAEELSEQGFAALTFDFRGYGESEGSEDFGKLDEDLRAVISYMRDRGRTEIYLVGASMGGTTSLVVAALEQVNGVVAISPPSQFEGQDALVAVPQITAPKLFLASEADTAAALSQEEMLEAAAPPVDSELYTGNAHGTDLFDPLRSEHSAEARQRVIDFLDQLAN
jgi:alpha-beta hydrolase superfamily lysophospholipase